MATSLSTRDHRKRATDLSRIFPTGFPLHRHATQGLVANEESSSQPELPAAVMLDPRLDQIQIRHEPRKGTARGESFTRIRAPVQDPDIEIMPSGFRPAAHYAPKPLLIPGDSPEDLERVAGREVAQQLAMRQLIASTQKDNEGPKLQNKWELAAKKIAEAQQEALKVEQLVKQAVEVAALSDRLKAESDDARKLANDTNQHAMQLPTIMRQQLRKRKEELAEAKGEVDETTSELACAEAILQRLEADCGARQLEAKIVVKAARSKQAELVEHERLLLRLEMLRSDVGSANARAAAVQQEAEEMRVKAEKQREMVDKLTTAMLQAQKQTAKASQLFAAALSEHEMADALVQRELTEAKMLASKAEEREKQAITLAQSWLDVKLQVEQARQKEQKLWQEARDFGDTLQDAINEAAESPTRPKVGTQDPEPHMVKEGGQVGAQVEVAPAHDAAEIARALPLRKAHELPPHLREVFLRSEAAPPETPPQTSFPGCSKETESPLSPSGIPPSGTLSENPPNAPPPALVLASPELHPILDTLSIPIATVVNHASRKRDPARVGVGMMTSEEQAASKSTSQYPRDRQIEPPTMASHHQQVNVQASSSSDARISKTRSYGSVSSSSSSHRYEEPSEQPPSDTDFWEPGQDIPFPVTLLPPSNLEIPSYQPASIGLQLHPKPDVPRSVPCQRDVDSQQFDGYGRRKPHSGSVGKHLQHQTELLGIRMTSQ